MDDEDTITRRRALLAGGATIGFGAGVAYLATRSASTDSAYEPATIHEGSGTSGLGIELSGRPVVGDAAAPVDLYYWTDYLCPFCARFEANTLAKIGRNYVDAGQVRIPFLLFPNIGEYSMPAAIWDRCVWEQVGADDPMAYWNWHGEVFDVQRSSGEDWADDATFAEVTERVEGVSRSAVESCRETRSDAIRDRLDADVSAAQSAGIRGTPAFVVYNRENDRAGRLVGAHPYENFASAIDQVLAT
ncbi:DSBA oxidoreductase [Salinarchaeum sp. Harcht-Bsk1]|uniref:DsbA family protein n=1 Tax=Salinarchaeum sp. Harcht-Bsk1 TaxID=1333523 RepID=UPI0003423461|nr:thioredoxin domain-containing protein [Salinarchaeum sp. Harcht-Bsk1]AGN00546.1 DSBA oxidoreductase [Salinarchaeum sp. Harcht-Bsk1]